MMYFQILRQILTKNQHKMEEKPCSCSDKTEKVVLSCSGQSDLGELSDLVARKVRNNGLRTMKCLAQVAINNKSLIDSLKSSNVLVIDGCPIDCAKKILENAGLKDYNYLRITDHGYQKGNTTINDKTINEVYALAKTYI
jgi:uncharacterized metal-binding protein